MLKAVSKETFKREVIENTGLSVVQFKKEWSGTCRIIEPAYRDLANSYNGVVNFYTVDADEEKELDTEYGIMEIPTILFFKSGKIIDHTIGLVSKNVLITKVENAIASFSK
jgi:thioredoxin 1